MAFIPKPLSSYNTASYGELANTEGVYIPAFKSNEENFKVSIKDFASLDITDHIVHNQAEFEAAIAAGPNDSSCQVNRIMIHDKSGEAYYTIPDLSSTPLNYTILVVHCDTAGVSTKLKLSHSLGSALTSMFIFPTLKIEVTHVEISVYARSIESCPSSFTSAGSVYYENFLDGKLSASINGTHLIQLNWTEDASQFNYQSAVSTGTTGNSQDFKASASQYGLVKIGTGLNLGEDGALNGVSSTVESSDSTVTVTDSSTVAGVHTYDLSVEKTAVKSKSGDTVALVPDLTIDGNSLLELGKSVVPTPSADDEGKVLVADNGDVQWNPSVNMVFDSNTMSVEDSGSTVTVSNNIADSDTYGVVKIGTGFTFDEDGRLNTESTTVESANEDLLSVTDTSETQGTHTYVLSPKQSTLWFNKPDGGVDISTEVLYETDRDEHSGGEAIMNLIDPESELRRLEIMMHADRRIIATEYREESSEPGTFEILEPFASRYIPGEVESTGTPFPESNYPIQSVQWFHPDEDGIYLGEDDIIRVKYHNSTLMAESEYYVIHIQYRGYAHSFFSVIRCIETVVQTESLPLSEVHVEGNKATELDKLLVPVPSSVESGKVLTAVNGDVKWSNAAGGPSNLEAGGGGGVGRVYEVNGEAKGEIFNVYEGEYATVASGELSHAEGSGTTASGYASHAEGSGTTASEYVSHAEGSSTTASGSYSHAEGSSSEAIGNYSHAEGYGTEASGSSSHAEGSDSKAIGNYSHAEGSYSQATNSYAHAEGNHTTASGSSSHAEGNLTVASGSSSHAEGSDTKAIGNYSHAEGSGSQANKLNSHAEGANTVADGDGSHAEGIGTSASEYASHAEGCQTSACKYYSHAEGVSTVADGEGSHAEGGHTTASGSYSHSEGYGTIASKYYSHAEGYYTIADGNNQHVGGKYNVADTTSLEIIGNGTNDNNRSNARTLDASGNETLAGDIFVQNNRNLREEIDALQNAIGDGSSSGGGSSGSGVGQVYKVDGVAKGEIFNIYEGSYKNEASGYASHAEGSSSEAIGNYSHAEGASTTASGDYSHAEGSGTTASGSNSHAEGYFTIASGSNQHVGGMYNIADDSSLEIIGNGTDNNRRSNARTLDASGNETLAGDIIVQGDRNLCDEIDDLNTSLSSKASTQDLQDGLAAKADSDHTHEISQITDFSHTHEVNEVNGLSTELNNLQSQISANASAIEGKADADHTHEISQITDFSHTHEVNEVNGLSTELNNLQSQISANASAIEGKADADHTHEISQITDFSHTHQISEVTDLQSTLDDLQNAISEASSGVGQVYEVDGVAKGEIFNIYEGNNANAASGKYSHAEGNQTTAIGDYSHAEGSDTEASGYASHAEGYFAIASGLSSHAEGNHTTASNISSHAEGNNTTASGNSSHAEGNQTTASGPLSHAEGSCNVANGAASHAEGYYTIANGDNQHVGGKYNVADTTSLEIIGNGTNDDNRSNARTLDASGNETLAGDIIVQGDRNLCDEIDDLQNAIREIGPEYELPIASESNLGGVKSSQTGTTADRDYAVEVNADGTMKVNVPWVDTKAVAGTQISIEDGDDHTQIVKFAGVLSGDGITGDGTSSETKLQIDSSGMDAGKQYTYSPDGWGELSGVLQKRCEVVIEKNSSQSYFKVAEIDLPTDGDSIVRLWDQLEISSTGTPDATAYGKFEWHANRDSGTTLLSYSTSTFLRSGVEMRGKFDTETRKITLYCKLELMNSCTRSVALHSMSNFEYAFEPASESDWEAATSTFASKLITGKFSQASSDETGNLIHTTYLKSANLTESSTEQKVTRVSSGGSTTTSVSIIKMKIEPAGTSPSSDWDNDGTLHFILSE